MTIMRRRMTILDLRGTIQQSFDPEGNDDHLGWFSIERVKERVRERK